MTNYEHIHVFQEGSIGVIQLNRPEYMNALNRKIVAEVVTQLEKFDADDSIRVSIVKGSERTFAAGADIEEMMNESTPSFELAEIGRASCRKTLYITKS